VIPASSASARQWEGCGVVRPTFHDQADDFETPSRPTYADKQLRRLAKQLPGAGLINPESFGWRSTAQWLAEAPAIFDGLSGFLVFGDTDGVVARGCFREWTWALERELPCAVLDIARGQLSRLCGVTILDDGISYRRYTRMIAGPGIDPAGFPGGRPRRTRSGRGVSNAAA
jgi:hypothetical protein